jgi:hypothetical protein
MLRFDSVVIGTMTIPGNSTNPDLGDTINFSFELDDQQLNGGGSTFVRDILRSHRCQRLYAI